MVSTTALKRDRFVFVVSLEILLLPTYLVIGGRFTGTTFVSLFGIPMDSVPILRCKFSYSAVSTPLTLWVILFFFYGVLSLRVTSNDGVNLGDSGILWRSIGFALIGFVSSSRLVV